MAKLRIHFERGDWKVDSNSLVATLEEDETVYSKRDRPYVLQASYLARLTAAGDLANEDRAKDPCFMGWYLHISRSGHLIHFSEHPSMESGFRAAEKAIARSERLRISAIPR